MYKLAPMADLYSVVPLQQLNCNEGGITPPHSFGRRMIYSATLDCQYTFSHLTRSCHNDTSPNCDSIFHPSSSSIRFAKTTDDLSDHIFLVTVNLIKLMRAYLIIRLVSLIMSLTFNLFAGWSTSHNFITFLRPSFFGEQKKGTCEVPLTAYEEWTVRKCANPSWHLAQSRHTRFTRIYLKSELKSVFIL